MANEHKKVYRCAPYPRASQRIGPNKRFSGYQLEQGNINQCTACLIEDLSLHLDMPTWPDGLSRERYSFKRTLLTDTEQSVLGAVLARLKNVADTRHAINNYLPLLYVMTNRVPPNPDNDDLWKELLKSDYERLRDRTVVFAGADTLRWNNIHISKQISWERSAQDFLAQWYTNDILKKMQAVGHFVLRFGVTGMIYSYRLGSRPVHRLFYDPSAQEVGIFRDVSRDGDIVGHQTTTATNVILSVMESTSAKGADRNPSRYDQSAIADHIGVGLRKAIKHCQALFTIGLHLPGTRMPGLGIEETPFSPAPLKLARAPAPKSKHPSPIGEERIPAGCSGWNILTQAARFNLASIAHRIVHDGVAQIINIPEPLDPNHPPEPPDSNHSDRVPRSNELLIKVPLIEFGRRKGSEGMHVIDRREVETYRVARNLIYKSAHGSAKRVLSIAIFGPPGAGKTFVVERIVSTAVRGYSFTKFNVAKCKPEEIEKAIKEAKRNSANKENARKDKYKVFFFDEFDAVFNGRELGALQFFLEMMDLDMRALFVFAGGTSHTYSDFAREDASISDTEKAKFRMLKGPDFVSRLRGHVNILGPNKIDATDDGYIIRRAITLRSILDENLLRGGVAGARPKSPSAELPVSENIMRAMLEVPTYKHGVRSMRALIDMCARLGGEQYGKLVSSTLPTLEQLDMHVDGATFLSLMK